MKILILINTDGGLYVFRRELLKRLLKWAKVIIALPDGELIPKLKDMGCIYVPIEFHRRGINPFADLNQLFRYISLLRQIKPDVVLTYTIKPNIYGGIACQISRIPYISNITGLGTAVENGGPLGWISTALYKIGLKGANCVFFQNKANLEFFIKKGLSTSKVRLLPGSGVNLQDYKPEDYPLDQKTIRFLFAGRIMRDKGFEELLMAMRILRKSHSNIFLDIVGEFDEDYFQAVAQAEKENLAKFHGMQFYMHPFYQASHCIVLPSYHEGMSNVLLEAAASGRPIIATRIPGCQETFDEGVSGFGCIPKDVDSLVQAMEKFLLLSQNTRVEMGKMGRRKMEREFDRSIVIKAYEEEIRLILK